MKNGGSPKRTGATVLAFILTVSLLAAFLPSAPAWASASDDPVQFVTGFLNESSRVFTKGAASRQARSADLRSIFQTRMDIPLLANFMAGRAFREAPAPTQAHFRELLTGYLVAVFYETIQDFAAGSFEVDGASAGTNGTLRVKTIVHEPGYPPEAVIWLVRKADDGYRIVEVENKGINVMVMERDSFASALRDGGLPRLILLLEQREQAARTPRLNPPGRLQPAIV